MKVEQRYWSADDPTRVYLNVSAGDYPQSSPRRMASFCYVENVYKCQQPAVDSRAVQPADRLHARSEYPPLDSLVNWQQSDGLKTTQAVFLWLYRISCG